MKKVINIGGKDCNFKTSAAIPRMYRLKFKRDLFNDLNYIDRNVKIQQKRAEALKEEAKEKGIELDDTEIDSELPLNTITTFENIAFLMHKHGDPEQPQEIEEWLDRFDTFDIYQIFPEILEMWQEENKTLSEAKNQAGE